MSAGERTFAPTAVNPMISDRPVPAGSAASSTVLSGQRTVAPRVVVASPMRIFREGLAHALSHQAAIQVVGEVARIEELVSILMTTEVDVVLFDLAVEGGLAAVRQVGSYPGVKVVVLGLSEEAEPVVACARAGIAGYVTHDATLFELTQRIRDAALDEFTCPPRIAATLLRSLATPGPFDRELATAARLTPRESEEVVRLIERGLSNKEIARQLTIQLATVKNHVHNILEKLAVRHRADAVRVARSIGAELLRPENVEACRVPKHGAD